MTILEEVKKNYGELKLYINGEWIKSQSTDIYESVNPATGVPIATFPSATEAEVTRAVESAQAALETWKDVPVRDKARYLFDLRQKFEEHNDRLCRILVQDHGRTIGEARGTLRRCIENIESACSALLLLTKGDYINELARGLDQIMYYEPRGVFLIITPNNIPMHAWSSYVPYALASGCPVIVSPSKEDPVCAQAIFEVTQEVKGFPPGLMNLVYGGRNINEQILNHPNVKGVGFIGSTSVGLKLFSQAGSLGKEASINGNGKNHVVLMPDADMNAAINGLLRGSYGMAGQRCLGADNILIVGDGYEKFRDAFLEASAKMKMGYGLDEEIELGPLVSQRGKQNVLDFIEKGIEEGAKLLLDGRNPKVDGCENGFFVGPTIFEDVDPDMYIARKESFGPITNLIRVKDLDEALELINTKDDYGHSACIFTKDGRVARKFTKQADVGNIGINVAVPQPYAFFPLGSKNASAQGCAKSRIDSMRLFLDQKTVTDRWV
ncbi:MAG: aldehyde dehydrogenase family protein [Desulfobacula sp.]|jgi:malonate-semialdehyde dehydrogenase (acetylating) / methylmalonate-semialdehyde dehydrogenase|uniref:aldehyde dehydrogenase family protein n=1 Tax=Desulfobacula sp. TaxID=2593537 RepID=UPI001ECB6389|nr:aldehyde dehydrogenase family protein [Desulfobacula sp.]MBT4265314.1 aldehyde dehydrogenase family protein [Deltaproteobacteria bacterium]MBT4637856.1 aldehyde dehydrogenase family protein [Deltaproteobacteria bacterium]